MAIAARVGRLGPGVGLVAVVAAAVAAALIAPHARTPAAHRGTPIRFATFNIEQFPRDSRQVELAFDVIAELGVSAVAVQEIMDPDRFAEAAEQRLGGWGFTSVDTLPPDSPWPSIQVGVAFDRAVWELAGTAVHDQTRVDGRGKPTYEVMLRPRGGGPLLHLFVVHLKSGSDGRPLRARQLAALGELLRVEPGQQVAVLGDFNATEPGDRDDLAALAARTGLVWASRDLACTAFWQRRDDCPTSRLDHVLTWTAPDQVYAGGACATDGCAARDRCPRYARQVSDHCPVVVTIDPARRPAPGVDR